MLLIRKVFVFLVFCFFFFFSVHLKSKDYGFFIGLDFVRHEGDFRQFDFVYDSIPYIGSNTNLSGNFGAFYHIFLTKNIFLQSRIGINFHPIKISSERDFSNLFDSSKAVKDFLIYRKYYFDFYQIHTFLSLSLNISTLKHFDLFSGLTLGYNFFYPKDVSYNEIRYFKDSIPNIRSSIGSFQTKGRDKLPISFTFDFGISYELPSSFFNLFKVKFTPHFSFGFSNLTSDFTADILSFGLHLNIMLEKPKNIKLPIPPPVPKMIDSIPYEATTSVVEDSILSKLDTTSPRIESKLVYNGKFYNGSPFLIKTEYESHIPLLNYVFFDYGSYEISKKYILVNNPLDFRFDSLVNKNPLEVYWNLLNIVGFRLRQHPEAIIRLIGCNSNVGEEENNLELSKKRAQKIAEYLSYVWEIDPMRIKIEARNLPSVPSNTNIPEGNQENQRVEIVSDHVEILSPVTIIQNEFYIFPDTLLWTVTTNENIRDYKFQLFDTTTFSSNFDLVPKVDTFKFSLNRLLKGKGNPSKKVTTTTTFFYNSKDSTIVVYSSVPLIERKFNGVFSPRNIEVIGDSILNIFPKKENKVLEKFFIILFDFNSSKINPIQKEFLTIKIKPKLEKAKKITLIGHTDIIGERDYNIELSKVRAEEVARALDIKSALIQGVGASQLLFDNKLPEGRFYSRTVEIIIEY